MANFSLNSININCRPVPTPTSGQSVNLRLHIPFVEVSLTGGHFYKKFNHKITCTTGFKGFEFSNQNTPEPISEEECKQAIRHNQDIGAELNTLRYPKCGVYSTQTADNIHINIEYTTIPFNKVDGTLIRYFFHSGTCNSKSCATVHPNIYWVGMSSISDTCSYLSISDGSYYPDEYRNVDYSLIDTVYSPPLPFSTACKLQHYCQINSYILEDGTLIIPADDKTRNFLKSSSIDFPTCPTYKSFKEVTTYDLGINQDLRTLINFHEVQCERVRSKIIDHSSLVYSDFIYLSSIYPVRGIGYRLSEAGQL